MAWKTVLDGEQKRSLAVALALEAGAIGKCRWHGCTFLGRKALEDALRLAESRYRPGDLKGPFDTREELATAVAAVVHEQNRDDCPFCSKWMDE